MENPIKFLLNGIIREHRLSVFSGNDENFKKLLNDTFELQKEQIKKAYEEGYDAAFHHEESNSEKYVKENL